MPQWSRQQDEFLVANRNKTPEELSKILRVRFQVNHSPGAVQRHAYRLGISLFKFETCPSCAKKVKRLTYSGFCMNCHLKFLAEKEKEKSHEIKSELCSNQQIKESQQARREYAAARAEKARLRKNVLPENYE